MSSRHSPATVGLVATLVLAGFGAAYVGFQGLRNLGPLGSSLGHWTWPALLACFAGAAGALVRAHSGWRDVDSARARPAGELAAGFVLLVAWVAAVQLALQPYDRLQVEVSLGVTVALWVGPAIALVRTGRLPARPAAALLGLAGAAVVAELALRLLAILAPHPLLTNAEHSARTQLATHRFAPGEVRFGFACNERGFYDEPFRPVPARQGPMLAVIADSFGAGIVPHALHFTTLLEQSVAGLEVYSFGVPAVGPPAYAELLEQEVLPLEPDGVLVCLFVGNDLSDLARPSGLDTALRSVLAGENLLLRQVVNRIGALDAAGLGLGPAPWLAEPGRPVAPLEAVLSHLPWFREPRSEPPSMDLETYSDVIARRALNVCAPEAWRIEVALEILVAMAERTAPRPFAVVLIPTEFQVEERWWQVAEQALGELEHRRDGAQRALAAGLGEAGIATLDLLPLLRAEAPLADGDRHLYHLRDTHWNARGNRVVARLLADWLQPTLRGWGLPRR